MKKLRNHKGQTAIEYAVVAIVLLLIVAQAVAQPLKDTLSTVFNKVKTDVAGEDA